MSKHTITLSNKNSRFLNGLPYGDISALANSLLTAVRKRCDEETKPFIVALIKGSMFEIAFNKGSLGGVYEY